MHYLGPIYKSIYTYIATGGDDSRGFLTAGACTVRDKASTWRFYSVFTCRPNKNIALHEPKKSILDLCSWKTCDR